MTRLSARLVAWFEAERRDLPWRRRRDPYSTWVSEVMLQQTTVDVVAPRFESFLARFPTLTALASATEEEVVSAWSGLGYYRRARGLHRGAKEVVARFGGRLPDDPAVLQSLPGIGAYTAGAIAALAYGVKAAAVDGNVGRVVSRLLADGGDVGTRATRRRLEAAILEWMPDDAPGAFTEALIELGALVCRPREPRCEECPLAASCRARAASDPERYPVKRAARETIPVQSARALVRRDGRLLLVRRPPDASLLPGFLELPGRWGVEGELASEVVAEVLSGLGFRGFRVGEVVATARHAITHHRVQAVAHGVDGIETAPRAPVEWHEEATLDGGALTTETRKLLAAASRSFGAASGDASRAHPKTPEKHRRRALEGGAGSMADDRARRSHLLRSAARGTRRRAAR